MSIIFPKYSLSGVKDWESLLINDSLRVNSATATLINCMPLIGINEISAENLTDTWMRISLLQSQLSSFVSDSATGKPYYITGTDLNRHIGLRVACPQQSLQDFWNYLLQQRIRSDATDCVFLQANGGRSLLELYGVG